MTMVVGLVRPTYGLVAIATHPGRAAPGFCQALGLEVTP